MKNYIVKNYLRLKIVCNFFFNIREEILITLSSMR